MLMTKKGIRAEGSHQHSAKAGLLPAGIHPKQHQGAIQQMMQSTCPTMRMAMMSIHGMWLPTATLLAAAIIEVYQKLRADRHLIGISDARDMDTPESIDKNLPSLKSTHKPVLERQRLHLP